MIMKGFKGFSPQISHFIDNLCTRPPKDPPTVFEDDYILRSARTEGDVECDVDRPWAMPRYQVGKMCLWHVRFVTACRFQFANSVS